MAHYWKSIPGRPHNRRTVRYWDMLCLFKENDGYSRAVIYLKILFEISKYVITFYKTCNGGDDDDSVYLCDFKSKCTFCDLYIVGRNVVIDTCTYTHLQSINKTGFVNSTCSIVYGTDLWHLVCFQPEYKKNETPLDCLHFCEMKVQQLKTMIRQRRVSQSNLRRLDSSLVRHCTRPGFRTGQAGQLPSGLHIFLVTFLLFGILG